MKNFASRVIVFFLAWLAWLALTGGGTQEAIAGAAVALLAALVAGRFVTGRPRLRGLPRRAAFAFLYLFRFFWEMIKANLHVALIVLDPRRPIRPGIIRIRTELTRDTAITILANSITLTPGTFTVDVDPERHELYIHCITVASSDLEENTRAIGLKFERLLKEVFE
jgi:multicomponent Na+:H+ antiporter subunit E